MQAVDIGVLHTTGLICVSNLVGLFHLRDLTQRQDCNATYY